MNLRLVFIVSIGHALASPEATPAAPGEPLLPRATGCNADNCARQVTGTANSIPSATRRADCSSFLSTTITYDVIQSTVGTVVPYEYPGYIQSCGDSGARYSSACSCWGVKSTTTTILPYDCTSDIKKGVDNCGCKYRGKCYTSFEGDLINYDVGTDEASCLSFCSSVSNCRAVAYGVFDGFCALLGPGYTPETDMTYDKFTLGFIRENTSCNCTYGD